MTNHHIFFKTRPGVNGSPSPENFEFAECPDPCESLNEGEVRIRTCYLSVDPAQRCQMNEDTGANYLSPWQIGQTVIGLGGVGVVEGSNTPAFKVGDLVLGNMHWPWAVRFNINIESMGSMYEKLDTAIFGSQPSLALCIMVGITSLVGMHEKGHVVPGSNQTCVVSGAAGGCGSFAGQIAKLDGCSNVVGICGSALKCKWLVDNLGFNEAIDYKIADIPQKLKEYCPQGIDVYFDNVGGDISDHVIEQMTPNSHIVLCGQIAKYNQDVPYPPPLPDSTIKIIEEKNITRERFTIVNFPDQIESATKALLELILNGKLKYRETKTEGLKTAGQAFCSMMSGGNIGKQIVHVSNIDGLIL